MAGIAGRNRRSAPSLNSEGEIQEFIAARNDVTELVNKRQELQRLLTIDTLTNLPNRYKILADLKKQDQSCVILIDILNFANINDFFGVDAGDQVIAEFAHRVQQKYSDKPFTLYKLHGDQLALLLNEDYQLQNLKTCVEAMIASFNHTPFLIHDPPVAVHITCGIAWKLKNPVLEADLALKQAKKMRKDYVISEKGSNIMQGLEKNHNCIINIKNALREQRVVTFYQPIVHAATGVISKYECLVRLIEKDGSITSPFFFLDTAKKARIYTQITRAVIDNACKTFKNSPYDFSLNLSTEDIEDPSMVRHLKEAINHAGLADRIILEILETEGFDNYDRAISFIREMKAMGCRIAIDDFGTGHSNYERLLNLHVDYLKIDGSIVKKITTDDISLTIVETIVAVAKKLQIKTVAEFVFDEATAQQATALGVDYLQGYYFSEPVESIEQQTSFIDKSQ